MDGIIPLIRLLASWDADKSGFIDAVVARPTTPSKPKRKLLDQVRDVLRLKHYSLRTYCDWIERFIRFHRMRHPAEMAEEAFASKQRSLQLRTSRGRANPL